MPPESPERAPVQVRLRGFFQDTWGEGHRIPRPLMAALALCRPPLAGSRRRGASLVSRAARKNVLEGPKMRPTSSPSPQPSPRPSPSSPSPTSTETGGGPRRSSEVSAAVFGGFRKASEVPRGLPVGGPRRYPRAARRSPGGPWRSPGGLPEVLGGSCVVLFCFVALCIIL